jgi:eukaryotic-like serine/threonine-protein kinase
MGVVYRGYDTELGRPVAIKVLASALGQDSRRRLLTEARSASALNHPHICTVHEVGDADGRAFLVMEYVAGQVLKNLIPADGLPIEAVVRYGSQVASALAHAHERGIVHGDLKPSNVIITPDGRAKVLDFGIARQMDTGSAEAITRSQGSRSQPGVAAGTLAYMAPELLQSADANVLSDIWALGIVLYEMVTGRVPFQGPTALELVSSILKDPVPQLPAAVPSGLASVIVRCLAREPGRRYQHAGEVHSALEAVAGASTGSSTRNAATPARPFLRRRWSWLAGGLVVLTLGALFVLSNVDAIREHVLRAPTTAPTVRSVAVLPLDNLSADPRQDYFADGMTETLISNLAQIRALKVISRTSAMRYKGTSKSIPQIARELNVDAVIEGSVQRADNRVRITAQLIHAATDTHLWAREYERDVADVLRLQSDVARAIANEIRVQLTPDERARLTRTQSVDPAAYDAYLRGRHHFWKLNEADLKEAIAHLERAIQIAPRYAAAYALLSQAWSERGVWGALPYGETEAEQRAAAQKAIELDSSLAEAHTAMAHVKAGRDWDWAGAEREYRRALELDPGSLETHHLYAVLLMAVGRHADAIAEMERAEALDPVSSAIQSTFGRVLYRARRYQEAIAHLQRAVELDRYNFGAYGRLADVYEQLGELDEAIALNHKADDLRGRSIAGRYSPALARLLALSGRRREALAMIERAKAEPMASAAVQGLALAYAALGDNDQAFAWLNRAVDQRTLVIFIKTEPKLDSLRGDPRWPALLRRLNLLP